MVSGEKFAHSFGMIALLEENKNAVENTIEEIDKNLTLDLRLARKEQENPNWITYRYTVTFGTSYYLPFAVMENILQSYKDGGWRCQVNGPQKTCLAECPGYNVTFQIFIKVWKNGQTEVIRV